MPTGSGVEKCSSGERAASLDLCCWDRMPKQNNAWKGLFSHKVPEGVNLSWGEARELDIFFRL